MSCIHLKYGYRCGSGSGSGISVKSFVEFTL